MALSSLIDEVSLNLSLSLFGPYLQANYSGELDSKQNVLYTVIGSMHKFRDGWICFILCDCICGIKHDVRGFLFLVKKLPKKKH